MTMTQNDTSFGDSLLDRCATGKESDTTKADKTEATGGAPLPPPPLGVATPALIDNKA